MASSASQPPQSSKSDNSTKAVFVSNGRRDMAMLLFALLVLFAVLLWFTFSSVREYLNIQEVIVSDYRGMSFDDAERELNKVGLDVNFYAKAAPNQAFNTVVAQSLEPNTMIRQGRVVNLGVHLPEESFNVPNLVGLDEAEAIQLLAYSKLLVGEVRYAFSDLEEGAVVSSNPPAQELLESGANVDLVISRGLAASKIEMPQLVNLPLQEAINRLKAVGINSIETVVADANYRRVGQVVNQRPQAGRVTLPSAPVVLYYAMDDAQVISVPNVVGMSLQQAYEALSGAGLELRGPWITQVNDPSQPQGIIEQQPSGFTVRGTPTYLVVNGAEGTLVTPSIDLTAPTVIGPDGLPITNLSSNQFANGQSNAGQAVDAFGNPVPNITTNGPRPVPLPSFITPISQFPEVQADGSIANSGTNFGQNGGQNSGQNNGQNSVQNNGQPFPNPALRNFNLPSGQTPVPNTGQFAQNNSGQVDPVRTVNIQPFNQDAQVPNVQIGLSNQPQPTPIDQIAVQPSIPQPIAQQPLTQQPITQQPATQPLPQASPPIATTPQIIEPATDSSVRNIPISFNPKNYGFIQSAQNEYRLVIIDAQGERELIRRNLGGDDVVNTMVTMYGRGEIQTYVNGSLFQAWSP